MVNVCSVYKCYSNKAGHPTKAAFKIPKDLERRKSWLKFLNRKDLSENMNYIYICELHFEEQFMNRNENRVRLINAKNPVPTIFPNGIEKKSLLPNLITPRKPPTVRTFQNDEQNLDAYKKLFLNSFSEINEQYILEILGNDFECKKLPNVYVFFKMESDENGIPKVSQCIRIDKEMHVTLYCNNCPAPLLLWFHHI